MARKFGPSLKLTKEQRAQIDRMNRRAEAQAKEVLRHREDADDLLEHRPLIEVLLEQIDSRNRDRGKP